MAGKMALQTALHSFGLLFVILYNCDPIVQTWRALTTLCDIAVAKHSKHFVPRISLLLALRLERMLHGIKGTRRCRRTENG